MIFGELLKISPHVQDVGDLTASSCVIARHQRSTPADLVGKCQGDGSLDAEERELGASEAGAGMVPAVKLKLNEVLALLESSLHFQVFVKMAKPKTRNWTSLMRLAGSVG